MVIDYCSVKFVLTIVVSSIVCDTRPIPPLNPDPKEDETLFEETDPFVDGPISADHGLNFKVGKGTFLNFNLLVLDTCLIISGNGYCLVQMFACMVQPIQWTRLFDKA